MNSPSKTSHPHKPGGIHEMMDVALPMVVTLACDTVMTFTDRLFLSRLGPDYMNASLGGGVACFLSMTFFMGLIGYTTALVAQNFGAGQKAKGPLVVTQAALIALAAWPLLVSLRFFAPSVFAAEGLDPAQIHLQAQYFNILILGSGLGLLRGALAGFFCGIGRTRVVMVSALAAMVVNAFMNWVLIFGNLGAPALGIQGSACGTILGSLTGLGILCWNYLSPSIRHEFKVRESFHFDKVLMRTLFRFGYPAGVEFVLNVLGFNAMVIIFQSCGRSTATAGTILFNWDMVSFVPLVGVEIGVTSLVGRYVGAGDEATARRAAISGMSLTWMYSAVLLALFLGVPHILVGVFAPGTPDPIFNEAAPLAATFLRLAALYVLSEGFMLVYTGALRGSGDTFWTMCATVGTHWTMVAGLFLSIRVFHAPPSIGWAIAVFLFIPVPLLLRYRWNSGKWRQFKVTQPLPELVSGEDIQPFRDL
jgi:MATE family multidrug resistance protein